MVAKHFSTLAMVRRSIATLVVTVVTAKLLANNLKGKQNMKKIIASILLFASVSVYASCPAYSPYNCKQGANGKMICGCGVR
jgi:hypothetical protein